MIVSAKDSVVLEPSDKPLVFAFAGQLGVFKRGMTFRDAVKAVIAVRGTSWVMELETLYPPNSDYPVVKRTKRLVKKTTSPDNNVVSTAAGPKK